MFTEKRNKYLIKAVSELKHISFWRDVAVEFIATTILLSVQCCVVLQWEAEKAPVLFGNIIQQGLTMGFVVSATSWAFGDFGGCYMNPAVTIAMVAKVDITIIRGKFDYIPIYWCGFSTGPSKLKTLSFFK